jgi:hypothetical protein
VAGSDGDAASVVGEECHIVSPKASGPRYEPSYPPGDLDSYENLMLLCRNHHKVVDDRAETYPGHTLRQIKFNHESWVAQKLDNATEPMPIEIRRDPNRTPTHLYHVTSGAQVLAIVAGAMELSSDIEGSDQEADVELVASFLELVEDYGDMLDEIGVGERVRIEHTLLEMIRDLDSQGYWVFGGREVRLITGGCKSTESNWPIAILRILPKDHSSIVSARGGK